ncbi:unnamed protein product [Moneuplotes crassus]|uniref:Uncharacterized protein n=1 Tax=Euplotes crassus TaxID=5936 RepID=A0AAD1XC15_EUPCR|nr:unnamed protein product [Moneuplotes crassus]
MLAFRSKLCTNKFRFTNNALFAVAKRGFAKRKNRNKVVRNELPGLRRSVYTEGHNTSNIDEEVYVGPTWVICPKDTYNPDEDLRSSHNWIKKELEISLKYSFPQHTSSTHRGKEFSNKFFFKHPKLDKMNGEKIEDFIRTNEIQRIMVFTDGWTDEDYNTEYGKMYISPAGRIISGSPENNTRSDKDIPEGYTEVKLPVAYLLRDLITECAELDYRQVFVFQNLKHYSQILTNKEGDVAIDSQEAVNKLLSLAHNSDRNPEMYNKLIITSLMNSMKGVKNVHSVYFPLILAYSNPGMNSSAYMLYKMLLKGFDKFQISPEATLVPPLQNEFSFLTSERACKMIGDMIRVNKFISPYGKKDLPKDIFFSGYSIQMHDFAAAISGCLSTFKYELDNSALELYR